MKPHLWLSALRKYKGMWACCTALTVTPVRLHGRILRPVGEIFYGETPDAAYKQWKDHHVGSA